MKHQGKSRFSYQLYKSEQFGNEGVFRHLAERIVRQMPMDSLEELFKFELTDPASEESKRKLTSTVTSDAEREYIQLLTDTNTVEVRAEIDTSRARVAQEAIDFKIRQAFVDVGLFGIPKDSDPVDVLIAHFKFAHYDSEERNQP